MEKRSENRLKNFLRDKEKSRKWLKVVAVMAAVVVFITVYALILPGSAWTGEKTESTTQVKEETELSDKASEIKDQEEKTTEEKTESEADAPKEEKANLETEVMEKTEEKEEQDEEEKQEEKEGKPEILKETKTEGKKTDTVDEITFQSDRFSVYGVVGTETLTGDVLTAEGKTYTVRVTYGKEAGIPEGASLKITEFDRTSKEYKDAKALLTEQKKSENKKFDPSILGLDVLDISIVDKEGKEIEPSKQVDVKIERKSLPENISEIVMASTMEVRHFEENSGNTVIKTVADSGEKSEGMVFAKKKKAIAEFKLTSFSNFTITWENDKSATVYFMDQNGLEVTTNATLNTIAATEKSPTTIDLSRYAVDGYTFENAQIIKSGETYPDGTTIYNSKLTSITDESGTKWQYIYTTMAVGESSETKHTADVQYGDKIYAIYSKGPSLKTVETVDNRSLGFHIYMTNYATAGNGMSDSIGGGYGDGSTKQGCYARTIEGNELKTAEGVSLASLFPTTNEVSHLFLKSVYEETGYFYYNSAENFASLTESDFKVYRQLGTPSNEGKFYYKRGNFMPYNTLKTSLVQNRNLYNDNGGGLSKTDPRYNEALYGFNESNDFYFGMYATADFYQPVDGKVNGEDMIYEFTGDDDMVVYIDGTLVLDLGGIHDAQSGYINFATGEVGYTNQTTNSPVQWNSTTIRAMFERAGTLGKTTWDTSNNNTFADGTAHKIQIFYQERGAGASNLKMKVNIPPIPEGSIAVSKTVEGLDATQAAEETYILQLKKKVSGQSEYSVAANQEYTLSSETSKTHTTDSEGKFTIKAGQMAYFAGIDAGTEIQVIEPDTGRIYEVTYTTTDGSGHTIDLGESGSATVPPAGHVKVQVKNDATKATKDITIIKEFYINGNKRNSPPSMEEFNNAQFTLKESADGEKWNPLYSGIKFSSFNPGENGEYSYTFPNLDPRKVYQVEEHMTAEADGGTTEIPYVTTKYTMDFGDGGSGTTTGSVTLEDSEKKFIDNTVTFKNYYNNTIVFKKTDASGNALAGAKFTLYQVNGEEKSVYTYMKDGKETTADNLTAGDDGAFTPVPDFTLPQGTYILTETESPAGYNRLTKDIRIIVREDGTLTAGFDGKEGNLLSTCENGVYTITVANSTGEALPQTGGSGTCFYTICGALFIAFAVFGSWKWYRSK